MAEGAIDPLDLSDEDFEKLSTAEVEQLFEGEAESTDSAEADSEDDDAESEEETDADLDTDTDTDTETDTDADDADSDDDESDDDDTAESEDDSETDPKDSDTDETDTDDKDDADADSEDPDDAGSEDENAGEDWSRVGVPFKANGKEIQIDSVDDAIKLMQMGANYNKKMAAIKPSLKYIKMLENNDLLSEDNLSYLIDLSKKDPAAITKLIQESGVNPMEVDLEKDHGYKTKNTYTVSDTEVKLDGILDDIRDTESFSQTIDLVSNKWDADSRQILVENPEVIKVINEHIEAGIYDQINGVMNRERMLGNLEGMSDLEAYKFVGDAIQEAGGFNQQPGQTEHTPETKEKPAKKRVDPKTKARKKAAGSTSATVTKDKVANEYDPLSMSDEDFEKLGAKGIF